MIINTPPSQKQMSPPADKLTALPPEIILYLIDFLPTPDTLLLSLTSKSLYATIGPKPWTDYRTETHARPYVQRRENLRWRIMERLERDLPTHHLCPWEDILRIHGRSPPRRFGPRTQREDATRDDEGRDLCARLRTGMRSLDARVPVDTRTWRAPHFCEVRMVTNRHLWGAPHGLPQTFLDIETPWLASASWRAYVQKSCPKIQEVSRVLWFHQFTVSTSIINNELNLQRTERCLISPQEAAFLLKHRDEMILRENYGQVCPALDMPGCVHHDWGLRKVRSGNIIELILFALDKGMEAPSASIDCLNCNSHTRYTVFNHGGAGVEVVVEVWENLGRGRYVDEAGWYACHGRGNAGRDPTMPSLKVPTTFLMNSSLQSIATSAFAALDDQANKSDEISTLRRVNSLGNPRARFQEDLLRSEGFGLGVRDGMPAVDSYTSEDRGVFTLLRQQRRASLLPDSMVGSI